MIALATTDKNWFEFLRKSPPQALVNFWTPTDWKIKSLSEGDSWYFVLKGNAPRKIGGGGKFKDYRTMAASEAWTQFGVGNGVQSFEGLVKSLSGYKKKHSLQEDPKIGCVILSDCFFLTNEKQKTVGDFDLYFATPIVKFKKFNVPELIFDTTTVFENVISTEDRIPINEEDARKRILSSIVNRQGQGTFRQELLKAYCGKCAVTGCDVADALEAAHISPYMGPQSNNINNGILLRSDIHTLFDLGLLTISKDFRVVLHHTIQNSEYKNLHRKIISIPESKEDCPCQEALIKHRDMHGYKC